MNFGVQGPFGSQFDKSTGIAEPSGSFALPNHQTVRIL